MTKPTRPAGKRAIATLLAIAVLWLAPSSAFGAMPSSHGCAMPPAAGGVLSSVAHHAGAPCQHTEQLGCPSGTCTATIAVQPERVIAGRVAPRAVRELPVRIAGPSGPHSAPPTPPPNR
ncbi:MAG TPA: hypothetical protein VLB49_01835 [Gemmatimonadales bacterium]|nr:hypothetical protein [Gemmatimonadales bacterium]